MHTSLSIFQPHIPDDPLIDMKYFARAGGFSLSHGYNLLKRGEIAPPIRIGRSSRWRPSYVKAWIAGREKKSGTVQSILAD